MKFVLMAFGLVLATASSSAWASGCNPNDSGSELLSSMEIASSGQIVCEEGKRCVFNMYPDLQLTGTSISTVSGTKDIANAHGKIEHSHVWGSCDQSGYTTVMTFEIDGQKYSKELSFSSQF